MAVALYGVAVGGGIAVGRAHIIKQGMKDAPRYEVPDNEIAAEVERYENAIRTTRRQLEQLRNNIPENAPTELGAFISLHIMLLNDATISRDPIDIIENKKINAEWALSQQIEILSAQFDSIADDYLHARKQDMLQVVERVFKNLMGIDTNDFVPEQEDLFEDTVLIAADLSPADTVFFKDNRIAAFVTDFGGASSHTAILGRGLNMPSIISMRHACDLIAENEVVIVDGIDGVLILQPDEFLLKEYRRRAREFRSRQRELNKLKDTAATTEDGVPIEILANIAAADNMAEVAKNAADGVGLYRSEFLFLNRDVAPTEEEQYREYTKIIKKAAGKSVTIRSMDLGADKNPRWFEQTHGLNPAMGLVGVRLSLAEPQMFRTQMRAILRAALHGEVQIMWPMISSLTEVRQCLVHLQMAKDQLKDSGIEFNPNVAVGVMIETPAAALMVGSILKLVDFVSIGSNDLVQYTLAVDRANKDVAALYQPAHPAVLKLMLYVLRTANRMEKPVSICGEMAGDPMFARLLLGMGFRHFSMQPSKMLAFKEIVLSCNVEQLENKIVPLLKNDDPAKMPELLEKLNKFQAA
ncbi:MAG: phosphoenolpyruvate--protein phosphotransferase [Neisseriaceae bacterium]|nr:phosphoenolpyruvate--protein phosphotransferase [Neisseriaceae bacterium]